MRIWLRNSQSHDHTIDFGSRTQWCNDENAMERQCDGNDASTRLLWCNGMMATKRYYIAPLLLHHFCIIASSGYGVFAHMRYLKKMATGLHCNLQLLWFIYHWSNIMHACIKCVYRISFFLMLIRSKECDKHWPILISIHFWFLKCFQKPQFTFNVTQHYCLKYLKIFSIKLYVVYLCNLFPIFSK